MNYPVWYLPTIGGGTLVALIAITHVFVAHFAVGGGLYLALSEKKGLRENNPGILDFTRRHAKFFLLITLVYGSMTGVGIWWIIALTSPAGTSILIHTFVFGWATEWVFFVLEIVSAFIYFYMFGKMDNATHLKIIWIYFISAWLSLLIINGIIGFMLTPGAWVNNPDFWTGFFNPSFWPSLFFRTFIAILLAGVYGYLTASFTKDETVRTAMTRFSGKWSLIALIGAVPSGYWYLSVLPAPARQLVEGGSPTIATAVQYGLYAVVFILLVTLIAGLVRPRLNHKVLALITFVAALIFMGAFEWTREAARRPFVINEVMYSNMILKDDVERINKDGFLSTAAWVKNRTLNADNREAAGKEIFIHQCYACHTIGGFNNDIVKRTAGMSYHALITYLGKIHQVRYFMPPFAGTQEEARALAAFIAGDLNGKPVEEPVVADQSQLSEGSALFDENCAFCHSTEDFIPALEDWDQMRIRTALDNLPEISEEMPPYDGTSLDKDNLAQYLYSLNHPAENSNGPDGATLFEDNCSPCHAVDEMPDRLGDRDRAAIRSDLDRLNELVEAMPPYDGTPDEKEALADYLFGLKGGAQ